MLGIATTTHRSLACLRVVTTTRSAGLYTYLLRRVCTTDLSALASLGRGASGNRSDDARRVPLVNVYTYAVRVFHWGKVVPSSGGKPIASLF